MDVNGDGDLTYEELVQGIKLRLNMNDVFEDDLK